MLADTTLLLRLYWTIDRRADSGSRRVSRLILIVSGLVLLVVSAAVGFFAAGLTEDAGLIHIDAAVVPGFIFTLVLFGIVFVGFNQALQALYLSDDLDKLLVAPIRPRAVMTAKLLSRLPTTVLFLLAAAIPALITFGIGASLEPLYYILGVLLTIVAPLFGISLGALIAIFMVRLLPARRLNEWVGAASIVIGVILSLLVYIPSMLSGSQMPDARTLATIEDFINHFGALPLPSMWVGKALVEMGRGQIAASAVGSVAFFLLITAGFFLVTVLLANRLYLSGWLRMQSSGAVTQEISERPGVFGRDSLDFILSYKDWLLRVRDPRLLATLFTTVLFSGVAIFFMLRPEENGSSLLTLGEEGAGIFSTGAIICGLLYFLGWMIFNRLATTSLSIERQAFYILKAAPVSARQLLRAKTFGIFLPYTVVITTGMAAALFILKFSLLWVPYGLLTLLIMGYGLFGYLVAIGFLYPNLTWDDPRRMNNRKASIPSLMGSLVYSAAAAGVALITYLFAHSSPALAIPIVIMGLASLAGGTWFFVNWITRRVESAWPVIGSA